LDQLKLAILQMKSGESPKQNLQQILNLWDSLADKQDVKGLCLPENSLYNKVKNSCQGLNLNDSEIKALQQLAKDNNMFINLGAIPLKEPQGITNATVLISNDGNIETVYRKIHLFDLDMGSLIIRESDQFVAGDSPNLTEFNNWKMAYSICYDVRFSELFLHYAKQGADIIFVPSAFTRATGRAHWHALLKVRAIENQCYIIAPAQTGVAEVDGVTRASYGHSIVVDPWGKVLMDMQTEVPEIATVYLSKKLILKTRTQMPMAKHRKL